MKLEVARELLPRHPGIEFPAVALCEEGTLKEAPVSRPVSPTGQQQLTRREAREHGPGIAARYQGETKLARRQVCACNADYFPHLVYGAEKIVAPRIQKVVGECGP